MDITLDRIRAVNGGEGVELTVFLKEGRHSEMIKGEITPDMFTELGFSLSMMLPVYLDREKLERIEYLMKECDAIKKGISLLAFARNTKKSLKSKLVLKGFEKDVAEEAAEYLESCGYINESEQAEALAEDLAEKRLYGKMRIKRDLYTKGFGADVINRTLDTIDCDFAEICSSRIETMGGLALFEDRESKAKTIAALGRYGFSYDEIREAVGRLKDK